MLSSLPSSSEADVLSSRDRSLLRDLSDILAQQMVFWGHDARHPLGNRLVAYGMTRIRRTTVVRQEGTSRYQMPWESGLIELHGFCAGWYPTGEAAHGALYIRSRQRVQSTTGGEPHTPGAYDPHRLGHLAPDRLLQTVMPLVNWWIAYEKWIDATMPSAYRQKCWRSAMSLHGIRLKLSPAQAMEWLESFAQNPSMTGRVARRRRTAR